MKLLLLLILTESAALAQHTWFYRVSEIQDKVCGDIPSLRGARSVRGVLVVEGTSSNDKGDCILVTREPEADRDQVNRDIMQVVNEERKK